ncbi:MAG: NlpC/P60 family protein [Actinomycetota bacterium]|nr:NlpC/P60 family protein [Actinomycetota bacterium]
MGVSKIKAPKRPGWRSVALLAGTTALGAIPILAGSAPAGADQITYERSQAAQIAAKISTLDNQVAFYSEQYDQANLQLQTVNGQIQSEKQKIATTRTQINDLKTKLANEAINLYTQGGNISAITAVLSGTSTDIAVRDVYASAVANSQQALISNFQAATQQLVSQEKTLAADQTKASAAVSQAASARSAAVSAQSQAQAQLNSVNSTIAKLVQQAQAAQAAAAAAKARQLVLAQLALQQTAQQAAQRTAQQTAQPTAQPTAQYNAPTGSQNSVATTTPVSAPVAGGAATAVRVALSKLGDPYVFAAAGPNAFDCSGLTMYAWDQAGVSLPHNAAAQAADVQPISYGQLQPGDLVFYGSPIYHVGIYVGGGNVVEANNPSTGVIEASVFWDGIPVEYGRV